MKNPMSIATFLNPKGEEEIYHEFIDNELFELTFIIEEEMLEDEEEIEEHRPQLSLSVQSLVLRDAIRNVEECLVNGTWHIIKSLRKIQI